MSTIEEIARRYWRAEESRDLDAILAFFTPDAEWRGPGVHLRGRDELAAFYGPSAEAYPGLTVEVGRVVGDADEAAIHWDAVFTDPEGRTVEASGMNLMRREGEQISSLTAYYDTSPFLPPAGAVVRIAIADRFAGRRVLVTGAGSEMGIGAAIVRQFVDEGAEVLAVDVNADGLEAMKRSLGAGAERCTTVVADITDGDAQEQLIRQAAHADGALDVLVNNAAVFLMAGVTATDEQWRRTMDVNLIGPAQLTAKAADALAAADAGAVVNIASISGHVSSADRWTYNASKGGVLALTQCQALDLAPRGIRVNSVSPGFVWTDVLDAAAGGDRARWDPIWGGYCPLRRCAEPSEIAAAVAFLASGSASYVTGSDLLVDGGLVGMSPDGLVTYEFGS